MPLPLLPVILGAIAALAVVVIAIIYYDDIVKWFRSRNDINAADKDNIAFTIKQRLENGEYKVVQGAHRR